MAKLKLYLLNGFYSSLIGAAVEVVTALIRGNDAIGLLSLFRSMGLGVIIGTASLFSIFLILGIFRKKPFFGYLANFLVVGVIMCLCTFLNGGFASWHAFIDWGISIVVAEALSIILVRIIFNQVTVVNEQLARKKAEIEDQ